ncbi:MAG: hypothetical protein ACP5N1_00945 [Candidatus Woesearchaeota archaeon]
MTTIFGICAFDPTKNKDYILLAGDSQVSDYLDTYKEKFFLRVKRTDYKKLIQNKNGIIALCGTAIDLVNNVEEEIRQAYFDLHKTSISKNTLMKNFRKISIKYNNSNILGSNFDKELNLLGYSTKFNLFKGLIFIPQIDRNILATYRGTGNNYAYNVIDTELKKYQNTQERFSNLISINDLIDLSIEGMKSASKNDIYTGGHMDIAIITKSNIKLTRNIVQLESH